MDETPKKTVGDNCFLCSCGLVPAARVRVFGKSSVDIPGLIESAVEIDLGVFSSSDAFVCYKCYKKLLRFQKIKTNLQSIQEEIKESYKKAANRTKRLRRDSTETDVKIIAPHSTQRTAAKSLKFSELDNQTTSCTSSDESPSLLEGIISDKAVPNTEKTPQTPAKEGLFISPPLPSLNLTSTPIATPINLPSVPGQSSLVKTSLFYPSKTVNKWLPTEYEGIGKALVYGPPQRIAKAVVKCKQLTKHVIENVLRLVSSEMCDLCSRSKPSLLRKCDKDDLVNLQFQSICEEWKERAPVFYSFLTTCSSVNLSRDDKLFPSVAVAGSVLLKQRNSHMNAMASVLGVLIKTGSMEGTLDRLSKLKITCSNRSALTKLDALGQSFDRPLQDAKERITTENVKTKELQTRATAASHECSAGICAKECQSRDLALKANDLLKQHQIHCHPGFTIAFDNIDFEIQRKNMTMAKQNTDIHWVNHQMFVNRVSGNLLPNQAPQQDLQTVSNMTFLPSANDQLKQRWNYIVLISRMLVEYFEAFQPLRDACIQHIPHKYSNEMSKKSVKISKYKTDIEQLGHEFEEQMKDFEDEKRNLLEEERAKAGREANIMRSKLKSVTLHISQMNTFIEKLKREQQDLRISCLKLGTSIKPAVRDVAKQIAKRIEGIDDKNKELVTKYKKEMALRKKLHNELVELKGNIRVYCRVRPVIKEDGGGRNAENVITFDEDDDAILNVFSKGSNKPFEMDKVFKPESTQGQVFEEVKSLVVSCIDGYNVCIFAYGQTGSGKTFTMEGPSSNPGINQRALMLLFEETSDRGVDWSYSINVSVIEIYNEMIRDLLGDDPSAKLEVKQGREGLFVPGLTEIQVTNVDELNEVFVIGKRNRATAITDMNEHSSRSHALLCVTVIGVNKTTGHRTTGKLNLVDLAGSERVSKSGSEGARMKEAQNINKSLSSLGDVIHSLKNKNSHVPYRNSKLTYLLQESLGGDSKTLMVVQVAPVEKNVSETVCSLNFAQRVRTVELGQATKKTETADMANMKDRLRELEGGSGSPSASPARNGGIKSGKKLRY